MHNTMPFISLLPYSIHSLLAPLAPRVPCPDHLSFVGQVYKKKRGREGELVGAEELDRDDKRRLRRASKEERRKKRKQTAMAVGAAAGSGGVVDAKGEKSRTRGSRGESAGGVDAGGAAVFSQSAKFFTHMQNQAQEDIRAKASKEEGDLEGVGSGTAGRRDSHVVKL